MSKRFIKCLGGMPPFETEEEARAWVLQQDGFMEWMWGQVRGTGRVKWNGRAWAGVGEYRATGVLTEIDFAYHSADRFLPILRKVIPEKGDALSIKPLVRALRQRGVECRETPLGKLMNELYLAGKVAVVDGKWWAQKWEACEKPAALGSEQVFCEKGKGYWVTAAKWWDYDPDGEYKWRRMVTTKGVEL